MREREKQKKKDGERKREREERERARNFTVLEFELLKSRKEVSKATKQVK